MLLHSSARAEEESILAGASVSGNDADPIITPDELIGRNFHSMWHNAYVSPVEIVIDFQSQRTPHTVFLVNR